MNVSLLRFVTYSSLPLQHFFLLFALRELRFLRRHDKSEQWDAVATMSSLLGCHTRGSLSLFREHLLCDLLLAWVHDAKNVRRVGFWGRLSFVGSQCGM